MNPRTEPEAGAIDPEVGKGGKLDVGGRLEAGWSEKWLCSIIRNYTHLPPFITSFWAVTLRLGMRTKSPRRHQDTEPSRAWNQDGESAEGRRLAAKEHTESKRGGKWSAVGNGVME